MFPFIHGLCESAKLNPEFKGLFANASFQWEIDSCLDHEVVLQPVLPVPPAQLWGESAWARIYVQCN